MLLMLDTFPGFEHHQVNIMTNRLNKQILFGITIICVGTVFISFLYPYPYHLTALLFVSWLALLWIWHDRRDLYFSFFGALIGMTTEIIYTHMGAWTYAYPTFLNVPLWLPFGWALFTMVVSHLVDAFYKGDAR